MTIALVALALTVFGVGPASAAEKTDVMKVVRQFVDAFNKGDTKTASAACSDQASIIDEFPPHEWHGEGACMKWMGAYDEDAKKNGITDPVVTLGRATHVDVNGDRAYVVVPANYIYKQKGKTLREIGSRLTIALAKEGGSWRITGWAWTKR